MQTKNRISVVVITKNEERNIKECLESVKWVDDIVVVDSNSTDRTVEIAKSYTERVIIHSWEGYAKQKSFAVSLANNEWVLSLDADERVSIPLADEIQKLEFGEDSGYLIKRENYFLGKKIKGGGWGNDFQLRLFRKNDVNLNERLVHEKFVVEGGTSTLINSIIHYSYDNLKDAFQKINNYSNLEASEKFRTKRTSFLSLFFTPFYEFTRSYFLRRGFVDGIYGLMIALLHTITKTQVKMKIWEIQNKLK